MFLPFVMVLITGAPRYRPDFEWSYSWTYNIFRAYEYVFGRRFGIKAEMSSASVLENGVLSKVTYAFHSWESVFVFTEDRVRAFFKNWKLVPFKIYIPILATPSGMPMFASPYLFAIAFDAVSLGFKNNPGTTWSVAHTITGSNTILWAGVWADSSNVVTADYNGTAMTLGVQESSVAIRTRLLYLAAPTTGANNINFTRSINSGTVGNQNASYSGAKQTGIPDATATNTTPTATPIATSITTVADNCWIVMQSSTWQVTTQSAGTNTTLRQAGSASVEPNSIGLYDTNAAQTPAGSKTLNISYTGSTPGSVSISMASFAPASTSAVKTWNGLAKASIKTINGLAIASVKTVNGLA